MSAKTRRAGIRSRTALAAPWAAALALALAAPSGAEALHGCVKRSGVLRVVPVAGACKAQETPISLHLAGTGEPAPAGRGSVDFVGCSEPEHAGNEGVFRFNAACQQTYGPSARMCESHEVLDDVDPTGSFGRWCWIRPGFQPVGVNLPTAGGGPNLALDASGQSSLSVYGSNRDGNLSCEGWSQPAVPAAEEGSYTGLVIETGSGRFNSTWCAEPRPVACCRPPVGSIDSLSSLR